MKYELRFRWLPELLSTSILAVTMLSAQTVAANVPDLSGMWLVQDPGSGSFTEWFDNVPKPALRPEIIKDNEALEASANAGNVVNRAERRTDCPVGNLPLMMASSPPLNIVQSKDEVLIGAESNRGRFIYMDRPHPAPKDLQPSGFGDSIGHWEGETLVVDTIGFPARVCDSRHPVLVTPGGGRAKDTTHLTERYRVSNEGMELTITFTWEDPTVLLEPHTYSYHFKKLPGSYPFENNDDPSDPAYRARQVGSVVPPPQN